MKKILVKKILMKKVLVNKILGKKILMKKIKLFFYIPKYYQKLQTIEEIII